MKDPTLERIWKARAAIAARCGNDPYALVASLRRQQGLSSQTQEDVSAAPRVRESSALYPNSNKEMPI